MLTSIVVDDEPLAHDVIRSFADKLEYVEIKNYFTDPGEALRYLQMNTIDLVFLDIEMAGFSGIELVKALPQPPMIIFTTAYANYAVAGFELDAVDYLLKPFSLLRFLKACTKAYDQYTTMRAAKSIAADKPDHLFIKTDQGKQKLVIANILYIESKGNYVQIFTTHHSVLTRLTMKEAEAVFVPYGFLRVHRSFLIAKARISRYTKKEVQIGHQLIPLGENYLTAVLQELDKKAG